MFKEKLRAFCEGLEMENIDKLLSGTSSDFRLIGQVMAQRIKDVASGNPLTTVAKVRQNTASNTGRQYAPQMPTSCDECPISQICCVNYCKGKLCRETWSALLPYLNR